jgi:hypothetical protein
MRWALLALVACQANVGTLDVSLTTAPGSHVLDDVETLRLVITNPHQVAMATRQNGKFAIEIDLDATGASGALIVDGLDASGTTVATGSTPTFPLGAQNAKIVVYMAAPNSIGLAPLSLATPRTNIAVAPLGYGAVLAGGDTGGASAVAPSDAIAIYNAFDHTLTSGVAMPAARSALAMATGAGQYVYLYGGVAPGGADAANFWRFDTSVAPAGAFADLGDKTGFERSGETAVPIGNEHMLISGNAPIELSGQDGSINARTDAPNDSLGAWATALVGSDGIPAAVFAGLGAVARFRNNVFDVLSVPMPQMPGGVAIVALPGGKALILDPDATYLVDVATGSFTTTAIPALTADGAAAATGRHLIVVDGLAGTASIYDAATLAPIATQALAGPRTQPALVALPNGQILIAGGRDANHDQPIGTLELFTPESTE